MNTIRARRSSFSLPALPLLMLLTLLPAAPPAALAGQPPGSLLVTPDPTSVTIVGNLQDELGCSGDWITSCAATQLLYDAADDVWQATWPVPAGSWEYKAALNGSWDENYGLHAQPGGANIPLLLGAATPVKFYYDHKTHWVTDNRGAVIVTAPGSHQSEIGCAGDWDAECLRSWLQDPDGDGTASFATTAIPPGSYEFKVAIDESWATNYGAGGVQDGPNIPFAITVPGSIVTFTFDTATHLPGVSVVSPLPSPDNSVWWDGLRHDSRDLLYRTPGGAVPAGTAVRLRFRTFHNDVTAVTVRVYDVNAAAQQFVAMQPAATDVDCYGTAPAGFTCDFWEATLGEAAPNNLWYRFVVSDGTDTDYYADNTPALDGGLGAASEDPVDRGYALMFHDPSFAAPSWARDAFVYQIFPDRFRNGRRSNDARTGALRYDDPVLALPWGTLPEGYCRNYADGDVNCPWRFDDTPPDYSPAKEQPRGRDYFGGDLKGVDQYLSYLTSLGVNTVYLNPIFDAASNHGYDTQDYLRIERAFGTRKDWENLAKHARRFGLRLVLDGVFNHLSSDSPFFDRYRRYAAAGACESAAAPDRSWFFFHDVAPGTGPCAGSGGVPYAATYDGWFGFDTIPVLDKTNPGVQDYFLTARQSVSSYWLDHGAAGWRLDVMGDPSFPDGYWETFREVVRDTKPDALIVGEFWQKDSTLLRSLRGDRADTTMNYRLRDAVIGLLAPGPFDSKGFADSGRVIAPTEFANRLASIREDYPDAAYYSLMNLLDSHDTERLLWTLTPGTETRSDKEFNAANLAAGKQRLRIASLIQFTVPGAPTVYYGDEVGLTGDDDPDNRRTYPWADRGGTPDGALEMHYRILASLRRTAPALREGDFRILAADDATDVVAYGRKTGSQVAVVIVNRSGTDASAAIPVAGYIPDTVMLTPAYAVGSGGGPATVSGGELPVSVGANSAVVLLSGPTDLTPTAAPTGLAVTAEGDGEISLGWDTTAGAAGYNVYRSHLSGGGWVRANLSPVTGTAFTDTGLDNGQAYFFIVTALDAAGNESPGSNEVSALPHLTIGWANLQWPPAMSHTISAVNRTSSAYGQVWIDGATSQPGPTPSLWAQLGFGPDGSDPVTSADWTWVDAAFNVDVGNNDEFMASLLPEAVGDFDYAFRYSTTGGREWLYADLDGAGNGYDPAQAGSLTVNGSGDTTAPTAPTGLVIVGASSAAIALEWDAVPGDPTLYGYEVLRSDMSGGPYVLLARLTDTQYADDDVSGGATYYYVVRAVDTSFNRSGYSNEVPAAAEQRTVTLVFTVTVPAATDGTGLAVYIAGTLDRLDGGLPQWDPGGVVLTRLDATRWTVTLTGKEGVQLEYKYDLGSWDYVEKGAVCDEISNRQLTLSYGTTGLQTVNDTVQNWRNVAPCGN